MIVAEGKSIDEILEMVDKYDKILLIGCKGCVAVCAAGGEKEVQFLASAIRTARKRDGREIEIREVTLERQCDPEYVEQIRGYAGDYQAILSIACGVGVQYMAEHYRDIPAFPGLNTSFMGGALEQGVWSERCQGCGNCVLHLTGGICPITRCSKSLLNGPCGGSSNGKCEVNPEIECGWQLIIDRLKVLGEFESRFMEIFPIKDWSSSRDGGLRKMVREDMKQ
ncbi:MAG: methylenetetrahydrofolate reductase C-terminal domain-containing protein [Deltaproteobacteria bacterium]|nr:MAG: methylenetetrahydrofolate reductase C-terminal domain-containing protein [Deltaproteobacteria bacterium]